MEPVDNRVFHIDSIQFSQLSDNYVGSLLDHSQAQLVSGNFMNAVVPMSGSAQYHNRRKYSPQVHADYQSSRIFYGAAGSEYGTRDRCREDFYTLASTPIPLSDVESIGNASGGNGVGNSLVVGGGNVNLVGQPIPNQSNAVLQQSSLPSTLQKQSPSTQANVSSVFYTVQRVITTSQIQTSGAYVSGALPPNHDCNQSMLQMSQGQNACPNNYQSQHLTTHSTESQTISTNFAGNGLGSSATGTNSASAIPRPLLNVIPTCVYLLSSIAVHMEIEGTAQCPAQVVLAAALGCEELGIANKLLAQSVFSLWMTSALLEIQLKPYNRPFSVRTSWSKLLQRYSSANALQKKYDEPMIQLRRNVFMSKRDEEKIKDPRILELLYEEARHNVLAGRYILEPAHSIMLGGIQARIELGPYNIHTHTISYFRENQFRFLPHNVAKNSNLSWMPYSRKNSAEVKLLEQFKRVPATATTRKLMRKYLEFCWALPFYGAAFFNGQIEQPVRGLLSFLNQKDMCILVAINERGVFVIDHINGTLLLGLKYEELSWEFAKSSSSDDPDCLPCIFIQFNAVENGIAMSKLTQVFSKQAPMMDALISHFAEQMRRRRDGTNNQAGENLVEEPNPIQNNGCGVLSNKLARLTLATFDDEGQCIGQMGSLSIRH